jgi:hypothetical protein
MRGVDRTRWRVRSVTIGHVRSTKMLSGPFLYSYRTPGVPCPVSSAVRLVEVFSSVNSSRPDSRARPINSSVVSGHAMTGKITFHDRWRSNKRNLKWDTWRASGGGAQCDLRVGKIPDTQFPNPNYSNPDPKYPNPKYPITISDSDCKNPKLVWVIRVMFPGTQTNQIIRNISNICSSIPNTKT